MYFFHLHLYYFFGSALFFKFFWLLGHRRDFLQVKIEACWCKSDICIIFRRSKNPQIRFCFIQIRHLKQNLEPFDFWTRGRDSGKITAAAIFKQRYLPHTDSFFWAIFFCFGVEFHDLYIGAGGLRYLVLNFFASRKSWFLPLQMHGMCSSGLQNRFFFLKVHIFLSTF